MGTPAYTAPVISSQSIGFHNQPAPVYAQTPLHSINPYPGYNPNGQTYVIHPDQSQVNNVQIGFIPPPVDVTLPNNPSLMHSSAIPPVPATPATHHSQAPSKRIEVVSYILLII